MIHNSRVVRFESRGALTSHKTNINWNERKMNCLSKSEALDKMMRFIFLQNLGQDTLCHILYIFNIRSAKVVLINIGTKTMNIEILNID